MTLKSYILGGLFAAALAVPAQAAVFTNASFETGDLTGWSYTSNDVEVVTSATDYFLGEAPFGETFTATDGDYFARLTAGPEADVYTRLFQGFTLSAAGQVSVDAAFLAFDEEDFNDNAYVSIYSLGSNEFLFTSSVAAVGAYGHTSWATFTSSLLAAGDYVFEAGVRNVDNADDYPDYSSKLLVDNLIVTTAGAVPEPATWAMMLIGFGGVGGLIRGRRRSVAAA